MTHNSGFEDFGGLDPGLFACLQQFDNARVALDAQIIARHVGRVPNGEYDTERTAAELADQTAYTFGLLATSLLEQSDGITAAGQISDLWHKDYEARSNLFGRLIKKDDPVVVRLNDIAKIVNRIVAEEPDIRTAGWWVGEVYCRALHGELRQFDGARGTNVARQLLKYGLDTCRESTNGLFGLAHDMSIHTLQAMGVSGLVEFVELPPRPES